MATSNGNISSRWQHGQDYLTKTVNNITLSVPHPTKLTSATSWIDDMSQWPAVTYVDIINYLVLSEGVDGEELRNYKSTKAYNYLHSNKIGRILSHNHQQFTFLKAEVEPSQTINKPNHIAWVMVQTAGCSCVAGPGRSCSHAAAVLWKVGIYKYRTLLAWLNKQQLSYI